MVSSTQASWPWGEEKEGSEERLKEWRRERRGEEEERSRREGIGGWIGKGGEEGQEEEGGGRGGEAKGEKRDF